MRWRFPKLSVVNFRIGGTGSGTSRLVLVGSSQPLNMLFFTAFSCHSFDWSLAFIAAVWGSSWLTSIGMGVKSLLVWKGYRVKVKEVSRNRAERASSCQGICLISPVSHVDYSSMQLVGFSLDELKNKWAEKWTLGERTKLSATEFLAKPNLPITSTEKHQSFLMHQRTIFSSLS